MRIVMLEFTGLCPALLGMLSVSEHGELRIPSAAFKYSLMIGARGFKGNAAAREIRGHGPAALGWARRRVAKHGAAKHGEVL